MSERSFFNHVLRSTTSALALFVLVASSWSASTGQARAKEMSLRAKLGAPILFTKRHSYQGIHIYDTYYQWWPGGGIYVLKNPWASPKRHKIRPVIDPTTHETLGVGMYTDPDVSYDGERVLFCFKGSKDGSTSIYEIGLDGTGLRKLTDPLACSTNPGRHKEQHDVGPAYLPDGRIVFTSTRPNGLVPCNNTGVDILHVMDADGGNVQRLSVNNVNEFDPFVLPDGRILHGRWEYVDKGALTQQSLWTIFPDSTNETALFANNMVRPEALLDARAVPGHPYLIAATLARHNATPRGSVAIVDTRAGKNAASAIANFEHAGDPTVDTGDSCEPWPLSKDLLLFSGRQKRAKRNALELMTRDGRREVLYADPNICSHSPILLRPSKKPPVIPLATVADKSTGRFFVQDIYQRLPGVEPGEVKWLRIIEETSRASGRPAGAAPYNQTFLLSAALAFSVKNILGIVPVEADGSAYFEVPAGRALYLQALDSDGRLIQSMRTFVQAVPGVTRSCIGCHERKYDTPTSKFNREALRREPSILQPESWGSGFMDYPSMVQPVFDRNCVSCHGGEKGFAAELDLSGGWTEHFNISYENLVSRRESQLTASLIAGIDCMNGTASWSAQILPPKAHGSAVAPLAKVLLSGHKKRISKLDRTERDLLLAWIDTNGLYYGSWDYTEHGCQATSWPGVKTALLAQMRTAGCMECHEKDGKVQFENDWFNLQKPKLSRILRAPLAKGGQGRGLSLCRAKKVDPRRERIRLLVGGYAHGVLPLEQFAKQGAMPPRDDTPADPVVSFASSSNAHYQTMLSIIRTGRRSVLAQPRVDMPGALVLPGIARQFVPPPIPDPLPALQASLARDAAVLLVWERSARTIGLEADLHRGDNQGFTPSKYTLLTTTRGFQYADDSATKGEQFYALVLRSGEETAAPIRVNVAVPEPSAPVAPEGLTAKSAVGRVELGWEETASSPLRYNVYRSPVGASDFQLLTQEPTFELNYRDATAAQGAEYAYTVRAVSGRGMESPLIPSVKGTPLPEVLDPVFTGLFSEKVSASMYGQGQVAGRAHGKAKIAEGVLDLREGGHLTFDYTPAFSVSARLSVECWVRFDKDTQMAVVLSCGRWGGGGWFLQRLGDKWRWYVGGVTCDGGKPVTGRWMHMAATYDGETARLFQDGRLIGETAGAANTLQWEKPIHIGQYSPGPSPAYQVKGRISDVQIYNRVLSAEEAGAHASKAPASVGMSARAKGEEA